MPFSAGPLRSSRTSPGVQLLIAAAILGALALVSANNFLVFHSLAELFAIVIGCSVFLIGWNSRPLVANDFLLFVGVGYLSVSFIDLFHLLAFPGVNVLGEGRGLSSQLWLAARFLEAATMMTAPLFLERRAAAALLFSSFGLATAGLLAVIFSGAFPPTVVGGHLTPFKTIGEVFVAALFGAAIWLLWRRRDDVDPAVLRLVIISLALRIASELSLTVYDNPYGIANFLGHVLKIAASYFLYKALIENLLMRPYATLFRELRQREAQLESAVDELESFSYSVSHDLRAPLTTTLGFGELLEHEFRTTPDDPRADYAKHVVMSAKRMQEIIEDLIRLGRLSRASIELATVDLSSLCLGVVERLRQSDPARSVRVDVEPDIQVHADPRLLQSAFENLLGNAWKFTAKVSEPRIEIGLRRDGESPAVYVRDNGAGFDPAKAATIFAPFARLHTEEEFRGTGIGLAIVQRIIQRHGGRVWAEGEVGKGATFYVSLPGVGAARIPAISSTR